MTKQEIINSIVEKLSTAIDLFTDKCDELGLNIDKSTLGIDDGNGWGIDVMAEYANPTIEQLEYGIFVKGHIPNDKKCIEWLEECCCVMYPPEHLVFHTLKDGKWQIDKN